MRSWVFGWTFILQKKGYKFSAIAAVLVGLVGVAPMFLSSTLDSGVFAVYLTGAFVAGFSMCMLNTVVNPMLNTLGGGGNKGNQLLQFGGSANSLAAKQSARCLSAILWATL